MTTLRAPTSPGAGPRRRRAGAVVSLALALAMAGSGCTLIDQRFGAGALETPAAEPGPGEDPDPEAAVPEPADATAPPGRAGPPSTFGTFAFERDGVTGQVVIPVFPENDSLVALVDEYRRASRAPYATYALATIDNAIGAGDFRLEALVIEGTAGEYAELNLARPLVLSWRDGDGASTREIRDRGTVIANALAERITIPPGARGTLLVGRPGGIPSIARASLVLVSGVTIPLRRVAPLVPGT